jgi:DNA-binding HxlR family transcriptional regulator
MRLSCIGGKDMESTANKESCIFSIIQTTHILDGKWSFSVLDQLFTKEPQRFNELRRNLTPISTKSLSDTLRHLEQNEIIHRYVIPTIPVTVEYSLTHKGKDFKHVLINMRDWGHKWETKSTHNS